MEPVQHPYSPDRKSKSQRNPRDVASPSKSNIDKKRGASDACLDDPTALESAGTLPGKKPRTDQDRAGNQESLRDVHADSFGPGKPRTAANHAGNEETMLDSHSHSSSARTPRKVTRQLNLHGAACSPKTSPSTSGTRSGRNGGARNRVGGRSTSSSPDKHSEDSAGPQSPGKQMKITDFCARNRVGGRTAESPDKDSVGDAAPQSPSKQTKIFDFFQKF